MGSTRSIVGYGSSSTTLLGGLQLKPAERLELDFSVAWNRADAAMSSFELAVPADYLARNPNQSFDFADVWSFSDLDLSRIEAAVAFRYGLSERFSLQGEYRYIDLEDDAPYLEDLSGSVDFWSFGLGWRF